MQRIWGVVTDNLRPVPYAQVRITDSATGNLSTLYDPNGGMTPSTTIANPIITDGAGRWMAAVVDGYYTITAQGDGFPTQIIPYWYAGTMGATPVWGGIAGVLANQTDLQTALNAKANLSGAVFTGGVTANTFTGSGAGLTSGTIPWAALVNLAGAGLLGNNGAGAVSLITLGTNLSFSGGVLNAAGGGGATRNAVADANYTITGTTDQYIALTSSTAAHSVTFPAANGRAGQTITLKDESGSLTPTIKWTPTRSGADTFGPGPGQTSFDLVTPGSEAVFVADGTSKWILVRLSRQVQTFTSGAVAWVAPPGVYNAKIILVAGGGAGAAGFQNASFSGGSGGGGGEVACDTVSVVPGTSYTVTIGAGGTGPSSSGANGGDGNDSSFGSLRTAKGGKGGLGGNGAGAVVSGGYAGGYFLLPYGGGTGNANLGAVPSAGCGGWTANDGAATNGAGFFGAGGLKGTGSGAGAGGGGSYGAGAAGGNGVTPTNGSAAAANSGGGGGGGGASAAAFGNGGNGGSGVGIVEWWV